MARLGQQIARVGVKQRSTAFGAPVGRSRQRAVATAAMAAVAATLVPWGVRSASAASDAWSTNPTSGNFGDANWTLGSTLPGTATGTAASGDSLFFGNTSTAVLTNNNIGFSYAGLTFNSDAVAYTIGGNAFTLTGGITDFSNASAQAINTGFTLGATQTFNVNPSGGSLTVSGAISDGGAAFGLTKAGFGTLTLSGINSYTGTTAINSGTLNLSGSVSSTNLSMGAGTLNYTANGTQSFATSAIRGGSNFTVATGSTLNLGTLNRTLGGTLSFNRSSATGTLNATAGTNAAVLNGVLPWATTFSAGTVAASTAAGYNFANYSGGSIVPYTGATSQATFNFTGTATGNYDVLAGNSSGLTSSRIGNTMRYIGATDTLKLNNAFTSLSVNGLLYAGTAGNTLTISGGYLNSSSAEVVLTAASGSIAISSPIYNANSAAPGNVIANSATLTTVTISSVGANVVNLSGASVYSGGTVLSSGELDIAASSTVTSGTITSGPLGTGPLTIYGGSLNPRIASRTIANPVAVGGDFYFYVPVPISGNGNNITMTGTVDLGGATRTIYANSGAAGVATLAGVVSNGGLIKAGGTTLALTATNTFAGPTIITAGTLQLGDGTNDGTILGNGGVSDSGTLAFNWGNAHSVGYAINGSGNVTKAGAGALTFTTGQTYTGTTAVNGGTLNLTAGSAYASSATTVGAAGTLGTTGSAGTTTLAGSLSQTIGGKLDLRNGVIDTLSVGNGLTLNGGTLGFDIGAGTNDSISLALGTFTGGGTNTINLTSLGATIGNYDLLTGVAGISAGNFSLGALVLNGLNATLSAVDTNNDSIADDLRLNLASSGAAATAYFNFNGSAPFAPASFSSNADGTGSVTLIDQTSAVVFSSTAVNATGTAKVATLSADQSIRTLTDNDTAAVTINGASNLTIADAGGITVNSGAGPLTIATAGVTLGTNQTWTNNSSNPAIVSSVISGTGSALTLAGGKFRFTGASTYTGLTTISSGAALQLGDGATDGTIAGTSAVTNNGSLVFAPVGSQSAGYVVSGAGSVAMIGAGTQTLTRANTYAGGTSVTGGTLKNGVNSALPTATTLTVSGATYDLNGFNQSIGALSDGGFTTGILTNGGAAAATLTLSTTVANTFGGTITGPLTLAKSGIGTLTLTGTNSYTGGTNLFAGIINIQNRLAFGPSGVVNQASNSSSSVAAGIQLQGDISIPALVSFVTSNNGQGTVPGALPYAIDNVSGSNTINGPINMTVGGGDTSIMSDAGTLTLAGNISITPVSAGARNLLLSGASSNPNTISGIISNNTTAIAGVSKNSSGGLWILSGSNTYTGATSVIAGTLRAGVASTTSSGPFGFLSATTVANDASAILDLNNFNTQIGSLAGGGTTGGTVSLGSATLTTGGNNTSTGFAGVITGTGGLVKVGTATQTLTGTQPYSGQTTISGGTLQLGDGTTDGSLSATPGVVDNGAFGVNRVTNATIAYPISGTGNFAKQGTATLFLTGTNTYSGSTTITGGGILSVSSIGSTTSTSSNLGVPINASAGSIFLAGGGLSGQLTYTGNGETTDRQVGITGGTAGSTNGILDQSGAGTLVFTGSVYANNLPHTLVLQGSSTGSGEIDGVVANGSNTLSLLKQGTGTWTLTGNNTYTGTSTLTAGTMRANNATSSLGTGTTNVSGGVLAGTGNTGSGAIVINSGAITAGTGATAADTVGILTTGVETWNASGSYVAKLNGTNTTADRLIMSGLTAGNGFTVNIVGSNATSATNSYVIAVNTTGTPGTTFNVGALNLLVNGVAAPAGWSLSDQVDTTGFGGDDLVLLTSAAPEPTSLLLAALTAGPLLLGRRRRTRIAGTVEGR